ncbi:kinase-like domain-containing protein [Pilobolus umbonatus]|nr:kinase-like domain-containing protein [Pilobolus umbonatus]
MDKESILLETQDNGNQSTNTTLDQSLKISPLGHRREASRGLGIDTDCTNSKTNAFFHTANIPTPRPPPSISRKISIKQQSADEINKKKILNELDNDIYDNKHPNESYAMRLRNLVAATRQASNAPAPSPIPHYLNAKKPSIDYSPTTPSYIRTYLEEDPLLALPTPTTQSYNETKDIYPIVMDHNEDHHRHPIRREQRISNQHENNTTNDMELFGQIIGAYQIRTLLGVGAFSHVYLANNVETNEVYAVKTIQKGKLLYDARVRSSIEREVSILKNIEHPNIVHLETTIETEHMMCLVLEYVEGGELFNYVQQMHEQLHKNELKVDEILVKKLFMQLLLAVKWLHEHNIVHRDLKLENILIHNDINGQPLLKITDFGLARIVDPNSPLLTTRCGSEEYAAPEIVQSKNYDGRKSDIWSLGIILYALLVGYLPFRYDPRKHERVSQLFYRIVKAEVKWPTGTGYGDISNEAKEAVSMILERNPDKRINIEDIEKLPWLADIQFI